ncbi:hypothetical protein [Prescottella equi]|uniref:Uncharacterized protein n=1 Tax=Prescottella equi ATCC 33707 TaxID=525370 RepID=E9SXQ0_RHOHA|nr:hypothetical protein [Prescottella equi]EGD25334.1 hypothetical protein HMPREF0724_11115 [Prescottella equi ATCC 33707]
MTRPGEIDPDRFGQLTYTSFDPPTSGRTGGGGWQIKEISGGLSDEEQASLRAGVVTRLEPVEPLPTFPTPEDLAARPRRLAYVPATGGGGSYWHTAAAGADASGRPGNVFVHAVLDRAHEGSAGAERPIALWRSQDWLAPYGPDAVAQATLHGPPRPGGVVDRSAVLGFLLDPGTWRIGVLSLLLDAVARALAGGPAVVLATESTESAALWIGAISAFMSPGSARRFGWCTFDRHHEVDATVARGIHLVAVPLQDAEGCPVLGSHVLISENETPELGELGVEPHRTARGATIPVTAWSVLAQTVLVDRTVAEQALARQDSIARFVADRGLSPMWPLAMAVVLEPELHEALDEAGRVVFEQSPDAILEVPVLADVPLSLVDVQFGDSTEHAWRVLAGLLDEDGVAPVVRELAGRMFLFRALADGDWIRCCTREHRELLDPAWVSEDVRADAVRVTTALQDRARAAATRVELREVALDAVATLDLLVQVSLVGDPIDAAMFEMLERVVVPILCDAIAGPEFVQHLGPMGPATRIDYLQVAIATHPEVTGRQLGARVPYPVLEWVVGETGTLAVAALKRDPGRVADPLSMLVAEGLLQALQTGSLAVTSPLRLIILQRMMFEMLDRGWVRVDLNATMRLFDCTASEVRALVEEYAGIVPARLLRPAIVREQWGADVEALVSWVADSEVQDVPQVVSVASTADEVARSWAVIRDWGSRGGLAVEGIRPVLDGHLRPVLRDYAECFEADLPHDLRVRLALLVVGDGACVPADPVRHLPLLPDEHHTALVRALRADRPLVVEVVSAWIRSGRVGEGAMDTIREILGPDRLVGVEKGTDEPDLRPVTWK